MATGFAKGTVENIDQVLLCQICLNPMINRKARQLSCLHTFCQVCLETILTRKPGRKISCSICRQNTALPTGQVSDLPLNFNIDHVHQMADTLVESAVCSKCYKKKEYVAATQRCITCRWQMCDTCRTKHDSLPGFLTHQMEQLEHSVTGDSANLCKIHKLTFCLFCKKCEVLLCSQCMTEDVHDSHTEAIQSLDAAMSEIQTSLSHRKRAVVKHLDFMKEKITVKTRQLEHLARVERDIIQTMDSLKSSIDTCGNDLIKELKENYISRIEQQRACLNHMIEKGTSALKAIDGVAKKKTVQILYSRDSLIKDTSEFEQLMSGLKNEVEIVMVKFRKLLQVSVIGKLEKTDLPPKARASTKRPLLTVDDLKLPRILSTTTATKPTLVNIHRTSELPVNIFGDVTSLTDGSAVFIGQSDDEILRINHQGKILSRYKPDSGDKIKSMSAFNKTVICSLDKESKILELNVDHKKIAPIQLVSTPGIPADGVCVDSSGNIILYDEKTVTKVDRRNNILWQRTVTENCHRVKTGDLNKKKWYLVNYYSAKKTEIWNEAGKVMARLEYPFHQHPLVVHDMTVSHRGTLIMTHQCTTCYSDDPDTVSEYAPDGSFIRHLLTYKDDVRGPYAISCDQRGYMWLTDTWSENVYIYKLS